MFAAVIDRMRSHTIVDADEGCNLVRIEPPASAVGRAHIARLFGGTIPAELGSLLDVTTGFDGSHPSIGGASLELDPERMTPVGVAGLGPLVCIYDYGNGDGMYLEPSDPTCSLWWIGHDSWPIALVARSLAEYVERCAAFLESVSDEDTVGDCPVPYEPVRKLPSQSREGACDAERDPSVRAFLSAASEEALVYDFRGCHVPAEIDLGDLDQSDVDLGAARRHGEVVVIPRRSAGGRAPPPKSGAR